MRSRIAALALALTALSGCVKQGMYAWGNYDTALYKHYREPQERAAWVESLKTIILEAEQEGRKVPPGIYAEYGYALVEEGQYDAGISYFRQEQEKWPESRPFMEKMIRNADRLAGRAPAAPAPGAAPKTTPAAPKTTPAAAGKSAKSARSAGAATGPAGALEKKP